MMPSVALLRRIFLVFFFAVIVHVHQVLIQQLDELTSQQVEDLPYQVSHSTRDPKKNGVNSNHFTIAKTTIPENSDRVPPYVLVESTYNRFTPLRNMFWMVNHSDPKHDMPRFDASLSIEYFNVSGRYATCMIHRWGYWKDFQHFAQQALRCVSWWNDKSINKGKERVMIVPAIINKFYPKENQWVPSLLRLFHQEMNVSVFYDDNGNYEKGEISNMAVHGKAPGTEASGEPSFEMALPDDTEYLRQAVLQHYNASSLYFKGCVGPTGRKKNPTIGFLNRGASRRVINHEGVLEAVNASHTKSQVLYVDSFDDWLFEEQAKWLSGIDILIR
jgi:hypothetical protein